MHDEGYVILQVCHGVLSLFTKNIPLATIGPFSIFRDHDADSYSIHERKSFHPVLTSRFDDTGQGTLTVYGKLSKDSETPHATITLKYGEGGTFVSGAYGTFKPDGTPNRIYIDGKGSGQFDKMYISDGNGGSIVYKMEGMTWVKDK